MKIAIGITSWVHEKSQLPELERCLDSLMEFYPVVVVDGKWSDIQHPQTRSIPEALELIESYSNVILIESPNQKEYVNRNKYLIEVGKHDCDFLLHIDTDEWIELPLGKQFFEQSLQRVFERFPDAISCHVHFYDKRMGGSCWQKRIVRYPMFVRHRDRHNQVWFMDKEVFGMNTAYAPAGLIVHQDKSYRSTEREKLMMERNLANPIH